jgi:hypothetical protein
MGSESTEGASVGIRYKEEELSEEDEVVKTGEADKEILGNTEADIIQARTWKKSR